MKTPISHSTAANLANPAKALVAIDFYGVRQLANLCEFCESRFTHEFPTPRRPASPISKWAAFDMENIVSNPSTPTLHPIWKRYLSAQVIQQTTHASATLPPGAASNPLIRAVLALIASRGPVNN